LRAFLRYALLVFSLVDAVLLLRNGVSARQIAIPFKIDEDAAQRLAAEGDHGTTSGLEYFEPDTRSGPFYVFDGLNKPPAEGSFGFFAVNPWSGDVWNLWGCHRLSTPALRKSQAAIRRRFTAEQLKQYDRLRRLKPICTVED
jgi:hypothetical protein